MSYTGLFHTHKLVVILFLLTYLIKTILLLSNKKESLHKYAKITKVPEMIISFLFLVTGIWMLILKGSVNNYQLIKLLFVLAAIPLAVIGFKKEIKALAILSLLLIIGAYGLAEMGRKRVKKVEVTEDIVTDPADKTYDQVTFGKYLYEANCVACHGLDGKKGLADAKDLSASLLSKEESKELIRNGKNSMPPYKKAFSDIEIDAVNEYIMTLRK